MYYLINSFRSDTHHDCEDILSQVIRPHQARIHLPLHMPSAKSNFVMSRHLH